MTKKVVLLLEDDESIQLVTSDFLSSEGYVVKTLKTIKSLWKMIEEVPYLRLRWWRAYLS